MMFHGGRTPIWSQQKGIFRPALLRSPGAALTIQTSFDSPYDELADPEDERLVYRYRGTDPNHPDNVALRRAMELRRPVIYPDSGPTWIIRSGISLLYGGGRAISTRVLSPG